MKKIYLILLLAAISLNLLCQTHWTKHPDNPVMLPGEEDEWDAGGLRATSIIYHDGIYHMWYTGGGLVPGETFIGYATSQDGFNWTRHDDNPVLVTGPAGSWDESLVVMPCVLIRDSVYHMWYTGQSGLDMNTNYKIGYATSPDGINWTKDMVNNPVLDKGPYGSFDGDWVGSGPVIFDGTDLRMWYGGVGGGTVDIGHATSLNGVSWTKDPDPVLTPGGWESNRCDQGSVIFDDSTFHMWYSGGGFLNWKVGYATSEDGSYWTKYTNNPVLDVGSAGEWDDGYVSVASVIYDSSDHLYKMWYNGNDGEGTTYIGYAESSPFVGIPDTAFLSALIDEGVDTNGDGLISYEEAEEVISLNFDGENYILCDGGFKDMTGIEAFINLDTLNASNQRFTNINVSKNTALKYLDLGGGTCNNPLASLDLTHNKALEVLICTGRQMDALDISNNTSLRYLDCAGNNLTELDLSKHIGLEVLICAGNDLTSLNLSNNTALKELNIGWLSAWPRPFFSNPLTDLNISNCSEMTFLDVQYCELSSLDLSNNNALTNLNCSWNDLTTLDLSNNIALTELLCSRNDLTTLDLSNNTALTNLVCSENDLTTLDLSNNIALTELNCEENILATLDLSNNIALTELLCSRNDLTTLDLSNNNALTHLDCHENDLTSLDVTSNPSLNWLFCSNNELTSLDLSKNMYLVALNIDNNPNLKEVCVWEGLNADYERFLADVVDDYPDIYFTTECSDYMAPNVVAIDTLYQPDFIEVTSSEDGMIYLVPEDTDKDITGIRGVCIDSVLAIANTPVDVSLSGLNNGNYWLYARDSTGNISEPASFSITGVGIEKGMAKNIRLYPNPTYDLFTIETEYSDHYSINITTLNGQQILTGEMEGTSHQIDLSTLQKGIFFITIRSEDFVTTKKILKL